MNREATTIPLRLSGLALCVRNDVLVIELALRVAFALRRAGSAFHEPPSDLIFFQRRERRVSPAAISAVFGFDRGAEQRAGLDELERLRRANARPRTTKMRIMLIIFARIDDDQ
jgi:hypothetical protein